MIISSEITLPTKKKYVLKKPREDIIREVNFEERQKRVALTKVKAKRAIVKAIKPYDFVIYTDGGFSNRYNIGSWSYLIKAKYGKAHFKLNSASGSMGSDEKLPILMEIKAVIIAVNYIVERSKRKPLESIKSITVMSDNKQVVRSNELYERYKENGWFYIKKNYEMVEKLKKAWEELHKLNEKYNIQYQWVKGHSGNVGNEHCNTACSRRIGKSIRTKKIIRYNNQTL
jgi:ribonuclease HI